MRKDTARNDLRELISALTALHRALLDAQADEFAADQLLEQRPSDLLALVEGRPGFAKKSRNLARCPSSSRDF